MTVINIAFCGLKHAHIFALYDLAVHNADARVIGIWDACEEYVREARSVIGEAAYDDYGDMLADPRVDIVAIGDAYGYRGNEIIRALSAGKHVLSDKPLCTSLAELDRIKALAKENGLRVGCMLDLRYDPALRTAGEMMRSGRIGEIRNINFTGQHPLNYGTRPKWYFDAGLHGGTFNDLAVHGLDAIRVMTNLRYERTLCARQLSAFAVNDKGFNDCAQFMGELENGCGITGDVSYSAPDGCAYDLPSYWRFDFWGDKGMIECTLGAKNVLIANRGGQIEYERATRVTDDCLSDLLKRIKGEPTLYDDDILFESTRAALGLQRAADYGKGL